MIGERAVHSTLNKIFDEDGVDAIEYIGTYLLVYSLVFTVVFLSIMYLLEHLKPTLRIVDNTEK